MAFDMFSSSKRGAALHAAGARDFLHETALATHLPMVSFIGSDVMVLREGDLMATLRLGGLNPLTTPDADLDALKRAVAAVIAQIGNAFAIYIHRISVPQILKMTKVAGESFAAQIDARWQSHLDDIAPKKKQLYLSILRRPALSTRLFPFSSVANGVWAKNRDTRSAELNEVVGFFEAALAAAKPARLTKNTGEWLGVINTLLTGHYTPLSSPQHAMPIAYSLGTCRAAFEGGTIQLSCATTGESRWGALFSIKSYPAVTDVALLDGLDLPLDMVLTNSFTPIPTNIMAERIQRIIRQMNAAEDAAVSLRDQLQEAADDQEAGRIAFGDHHLSIAAYTSDRQTLEHAAAEVKRLGQEAGAVVVRETMALKATYFAQVPGNFGYRARRTPISTINFADFAALHGSVEGQPPTHSPWGETITAFPGTGSSAYRFNFHEAGHTNKEPTVGHTLILGRTGSGKSVIAAFLAAQAQRIGARVFVFDKDQGLEMAIRALGGHYNQIKAGLPTGMTPLKSETDTRGKAWLTDWMSALSESAAALTPEQAKHLQHAVAQNAKAGDALQNFDTFATLFQSLDDEGALHARISQWAPGSRYGWVFDHSLNEHALRTTGNVVGFDMTEILDMTTERTAVLAYIFRLIERQIEDRGPTLIILDEAWKLLDDDYFATRLENWLVTLRKMNCVVVMLTQYPGQLQNARVGKTIVETIPTQILFPNDHTKPSDYNLLGVNEKEAALLTETTAGQRIALVRSASESVFIDADLSALGSLLTILGGGQSGAAIAGPDWRSDPTFWRVP
ncbi:helicase HerA domain-containing protein [Cognatishimia sp. MH4019]|uniref:VirB4 family type IV secretion/conjugal transfer ATPase n=1 Tax=Cognatishimia sp. MH4019 TaxID=2854030 RepID=UPI001CD6EC94|nr:DUF87 domain-containing protein [Cognatishimia sp. MH4019]